LPAAYWAFCARIALAMSVGVTPRRAILSGCSQTRIEYPEPKSVTSPTPGMRLSSSIRFTVA
jgi:hypothetical protein